MPNRITTQQPFRQIRRFLRRAALAAVGAGVLLGTALTGPARACGTCGCEAWEHGAWNIGGSTRGVIAEQHRETRWGTSEEFDDWELFLIDVFFTEHFLPAMMLMTQQLTAVAMQQMLIVGTFFDAKQQMETQRLFDQMKAEAHRDYQPSTGMCVFGTTIRSLAAAERRGEIVQMTLSQRAQDRQLGHTNTSATEGPELDKRNRFIAFTRHYCQRQDHGTDLAVLCPRGPAGPQLNRDVDYTRLIDRNMTLNIDMTDLGAGATADERDVFALASNLYAHTVFQRMPESLFRTNEAGENQNRWMALRAIAAKRSVAENSFNTIVGMRAPGTPAGGTPAEAAGPSADGESLGPQGSAPDTARYLRVILDQLGLSDPAEMTAYLGARPSYFAQMDVLTKKMYQRPAFYTDLYDTPANVERKTVAMQAIGLMQDFDTLKSYLRQEMILAILVEMELAGEQSLLEDKLGSPAIEGLRQERIDP